MSFFKKYISGSSYYGKLILLISILVAIPVIILPFYPEEAVYAPVFLITALCSLVFGILVCIILPNQKESITEWQSPLQKGSLPVLFAWLYGILMGAIPFVIANKLSFIQALFESTSGWTTTGLAVIDVTVTPKIFLFHRAFMQYSGGLGFIMMIIMLVEGKHAMHLYSAEGHPDKLMPNLKQTTRMIFLMYNGFLALGTLLYCIFGMPLFDAVCHTMSALSTAGFTTEANSIGSYNSLGIEIVSIVLMIIGSTNFAVLLLLVRKKFGQVMRISETRFLFVLLFISVPIIAFSLIERGGAVGESFRQAVFGAVTTFSTTGYSTSNYSQWPPIALGLVFVLMIVGGGIGSTAGGIKLQRTYVLLRGTEESIHRRLLPARSVSAPHYHRASGRGNIDGAIILEYFGFVSCYMIILVVSTLILTFTASCSLGDAFFEFTSAFGTVGVSNGITNPDASIGTMIILMTGMLLGRLEIYIVFIGVYSGFKESQRLLHRLVHRKARG